MEQKLIELKARTEGATHKDNDNNFYRFNRDPQDWGWQIGAIKDGEMVWKRYPGHPDYWAGVI